MISAVEAAIDQIHASIPIDILELAFRTQYNQGESLDYLIKKEVLLRRVKRDASLRGGKVLQIVLESAWARYTSSPSPYSQGVAGSYNVFVIPPMAREHRDIVAVLSVRFPYALSSSTGNTVFSNFRTNGNTLYGLARATINNMTNSCLMTNPTGELRESNTIVIDPTQYNFVPWHVLVRLEYDDEFTGMEVSAIRPFCLLCESAVKSYIWSKLIVQVESNMVYRGANLGVVRDLISDYASANEQYDEQLLELGGSEVLDTDRQRRILMAIVPRK